MPTTARPRVVAGLRLLAPVGRGAEGEVWEARDGRGRRRALKLIRPDALVDPEEVQRRGAWLVEVEHPALVRVWRTGVLRGAGLDGWGFVEMTFVDGRSTHTLPPLPGVLDRLGDLAEGLDLLHAGAWSQGVPLVHRDVKPANLIEAVDGDLVLVDHSTLRAVGADTVTRIGTPVFAAPEVVSGRMGPPADVYSFCATAVALLTGARGETLAGLLDDPAALDIPEGLRAGLRAQPDERPWSCRTALELPGFAVSRSPAPGRPTDGPPASGADGAAVLPAPPREPAEELAGDTEVLRAPGGEADMASPPGDATQVLAGSDRTEVLRDARADGTQALPVAQEADDLLPLAPPAPEDGGTLVYRPGELPFEPAGLDGVASGGGPRSVAGWLLALAVVVAAPGVAALLGLPLWPDAAAVLAAAWVAHLCCFALHGRHMAAGLLAPPLGWAFLLSGRLAPGGRRRDWALPLLLGALLVVGGAVLAALRVLVGGVTSGPAGRWVAALPGAGLDAVAAVAATVAALGLLALCVRTARRGGAALRVLTAPLWAAGATVLLGAGVLLVPFALLGGRAGALLRLLGRTVTGAAAIARPDAPPAPGVGTPGSSVDGPA